MASATTALHCLTLCDAVTHLSGDIRSSKQLNSAAIWVCGQQHHYASAAAALHSTRCCLHKFAHALSLSQSYACIKVDRRSHLGKKVSSEETDAYGNMQMKP